MVDPPSLTKLKADLVAAIEKLCSSGEGVSPLLEFEFWDLQCKLLYSITSKRRIPDDLRGEIAANAVIAASRQPSRQAILIARSLLKKVEKPDSARLAGWLYSRLQQQISDQIVLYRDAQSREAKARTGVRHGARQLLHGRNAEPDDLTRLRETTTLVESFKAELGERPRQILEFLVADEERNDIRDRLDMSEATFAPQLSRVRSQLKAFLRRVFSD
jgi:hypothetical protein